MGVSKLNSFIGFLKTFWQMAKDDWQELDHKLPRIAAGAISFIVVALFWLYFFNGSSPFRLF
jgi:hypothetical protein